MRCHAAFCSFWRRLYSAIAACDLLCSLADYIAMPVEAAVARTLAVVKTMAVVPAILERLD
jgi:hypothetical protein